MTEADAGDHRQGHLVERVNFVADLGRVMLESSTSVSEVTERLHRFLPVIGLDDCSIDANLGTLTLSYWQPSQPVPITVMRGLEVAGPRLE